MEGRGGTVGVCVGAVVGVRDGTSEAVWVGVSVGSLVKVRETENLGTCTVAVVGKIPGKILVVSLRAVGDTSTFEVVELHAARKVSKRTEEIIVFGIICLRINFCP